ncbi:HDOD domain-containing protein [Thioalkalivibrio sp. ALJ3]|uniref:HDOD domain-containing protein n=1 Tax=Thioalkalivibrio sp. ALJ3 TaxID=1240557 RepID=UPI000376AEA3|nr:HDOD domain-containing protein [Thioalkalivibrio sp. ALJ3]
MATAYTATETETIPSLPQALISVLDASQAGEADFEALSRAILRDTGMTSRLLAAANSPFYYRGSPCRTIDRALFSLGLDTVRSLALTAAIQQLFGHYQPRHRSALRIIWRQALTTAMLGQVLASLTRYPRPEDAYLAGLLVDLGKLMRLATDEASYWPVLEGSANDRELVDRERETYGQHHAELAAQRLGQWGLNGFVADAVRFHLEPTDQVRDAHHLVKVTHLAHRLGCEDPDDLSDPALAAAHDLFGLNEGLTRELRKRIEDDVERVAGSLGIELDSRPDPAQGDETDPDQAAREALGMRVRDLTELERLTGEMLRTEGPHERARAAQRTLFLTLGLERSLIFLTDTDGMSVSAWLDEEDEPDFTLPLLPGRSLVTDTLLEREMRRHELATETAAPVIDQQLFRLCEAEILWAFPLLADRQAPPAGVLILGLDTARAQALEERSEFIRALAREIARALVAPDTPHVEPLERRRSDQATQQRIRETLHEAGNPLSIIQNYLGVLNAKLGEEHEANHELALIKEEIDRVGRILLRLQDPNRDITGPTATLNRLVQDVAEIVDHSLCRTRGIRMELDLAPGDPPLSVPSDHVRQILTNLLKNAAEALESGGCIRLQTRDPEDLHGQRVVTLVVADDGPGLPEEVRAAHYRPVKSQKGASHAGLGLSIVRRLADEIGAHIHCDSDREGTRFEIRLPHRETEAGEVGTGQG